MQLFLNTNRSSLSIQNRLNSTNGLLSNIYTRLSSGLRINSAKDDAAGLSISTRFSSQIRGLNFAVRNSEDGISLAQTGEGAMTEITNTLNRMRELAVQAANATNNDLDREAIQLEMDQYKQDIEQVVKNTNFNGSNLLNGSFLKRNLQIGADSGDFLSVTVRNMDISELGQQAQVVSGEVDGNAFNGSSLVISYRDAFGETANATVRATVDADDSLSTTAQSSSAIAKATAINSLSEITNVTATVQESSVIGSTISGGEIVDAFSINGHAISGITVEANDASGTLIDTINALHEDTGVIAHLDASSQLVLTAADGRNIEITGVSATLNGITGLSNGVTRGSLILHSDQQFEVSGGADLAAIDVTSGVYGVNSDMAIESIDVSTTLNSSQAISSIDRALDDILSERTKLGALQNRLSSRVEFLQTNIQSLTDANQRIVGADFAKETTRLAELMILQQAGVSLLAQSNQSPAMVLNLLRF